MSRLTLSLLGSLHIDIDGVSANIATRKAAALLIYLAVTGHAHGRDTLAALLWPEFDSAQAKASLRRALVDIKKAIGDGWLIIHRQSLELNEQADIQLDVHTFRSLLALPPEQTEVTTFTQAIDLYRADFLSGFSLRDSPAFDEWQFFEQENLRQLLAHALETVIGWYQARGEFLEAIPYGRRCVTLDPLHEPAHRQLMQLYAHNGQQAAALRQFELCQRLLAEELGVEPDPTTTALYQQLKSQRPLAPPQAAHRFPDADTPANRHNLPPNPTSFVGRDEELGQLATLLDDAQVRLLTLVGLGGVGKTRLALQAAAQQLAHFPDGVWYVDLVPLQTVDEVFTAVATLLDFTFSGPDSPHQQFGAYLKEKKMLWLLDNFEHLVDDTTPLSNVLSQVPGLKIITTSRERLDLAEEWLYQVDGLSYPQVNPIIEQSAVQPTNLLPPSVNRNQFTAVQLFTQRARQAQHNFSLPKEETHVVHICQLVEGMPLALELAAAWVRLLPCWQIAHEIQQSLDFLATTQRNVSDRHRSVRAVFEYSWRMLSPSEQNVLARLSVFRGRFTAEAAQAVADATLFTLYSLLNKSLVRRNGQNYYELHELLRQFAAQKLTHLEAEPDRVPERHMAYYTTFLHHHEKALFGAEQTAVITLIGQEIDNVYQAWLWAAQNGRIAALNQSFQAMYHYHAMRSRYQLGERLFAQTLAKLEPYLPIADKKTNVLLTKLTVYRGEYLYTLGKINEAEKTLRQALSITHHFQMENERELATQTLGVITYLQGNYTEAKQLLAGALELAINLSDLHRQAYILMSMGAVEQALGNYAEAQKWHQTSLNMFDDLNYQWGTANTQRFLGLTAYHQGHYAQAQLYYQQSLELCQSLNYETGIALALNHLGTVAESSNQVEEAHRLYQQALVYAQESHARWSEAATLQNLGRIFSVLDQQKKGWHHLCQALDIAMQTEAIPLILDILMDITHPLEVAKQHEQVLMIATFVSQHPASRWETQLKASHLQAKLASSTIPQIVLKEPNTLQHIVNKIINSPH